MTVVLVPGFTQTARVWDRVVGHLPDRVDPLALEVPTGLDFVATAVALGDAGGSATYVGYSMGGRLCLRLALDRPDLVERLVLVSASPGIADPDERERRRADDDEWARLIEREGVDAFYGRWLAQPLFATLPRDATALDARLRDPAVLTHQLRVLGQGAMEPLWDRLAELAMPVTLVVGGRDPKYAALADEMGGPVEIIEGAGHALHLEEPQRLAAFL